MNHAMQSSAVVLPNAHGYISYRRRGRPGRAAGRWRTAFGVACSYIRLAVWPFCDGRRPATWFAYDAGPPRYITRRPSKPRRADRAIHKAAAVAASAADAESAALDGASASSITAVWRLSSKQAARHHRRPFVISFRRRQTRTIVEQQQQQQQRQ